MCDQLSPTARIKHNTPGLAHREAGLPRRVLRLPLLRVELYLQQCAYPHPLVSIYWEHFFVEGHRDGLQTNLNRPSGAYFAPPCTACEHLAPAHF